MGLIDVWVLVHPFRKNFDQLVIGDALKTHRRTVTEADIVNFGCLSGDHFYAHFDEVAAKDSFFGQARRARVFCDRRRRWVVCRSRRGASDRQLWN